MARHRSWRRRHRVPRAFVALFVAVIASLVAGITLATTTDTLEELPGLLLLVPAALAVKGNIFGALGSRLGTSIHTGVFQFSPRLDTVVGQNTAAALILSLVVSVELALLAKGVAIVFNVSPTMSTIDFITVSAVGGDRLRGRARITSRVSGSVRFGWDLDNVVAPLVTATGDVILPAWWAVALTGEAASADPSQWSCRRVSSVPVVVAHRPHHPPHCHAGVASDSHRRRHPRSHRRHLIEKRSRTLSNSRCS